MTGFDADTALAPTGPGRFDAFVPASWFVTTGPNGGFLAALAARALTEMTDRPPRSLTLHYLEAPDEGPLEVTCEVVREGRTTVYLRVEMLRDGRPVCLGLAACAPWRDDQPEWFDAQMPEVPAPDDLSRFEGVGVPPFFANYDARLIPSEPQERPARVSGWIRTAEPHAIDAPLLAAMSDAWFPPAFLRLEGRGFVPTIDLTIHWRAPAPAGEHPWILGTFISRLASGGTVEEDGELWSEDGTLLVQSRQLAVVRRPK
jgi:acyl-CoA thioesterase